MHGRLDEAALQVRDLGVRYATGPALEDVSLHVHPGEVVALLGPNGAGKTSLLRAVMGLVAHTGSVTVHTRRPSRAGVAFVPQRADVDLQFPITVQQVVGDGRRPFVASWRRLRREDRTAVARALSTVGLDGLERRAIGELSGGQLQRAFLARALAQEADLLLLDEPLAGVDAPTAEALTDLLHSLARSGRTVVISTHDLGHVLRRYARCVILNRTLLADGPPAEVLRAEELERSFLGVG